jgi:NTP pyrophosphatase (non-canonical NTP hydrolase)
LAVGLHERPLHKRDPDFDEPKFPAADDGPDNRVYFFRLGWNHCRDVVASISAPPATTEEPSAVVAAEGFVLAPTEATDDMVKAVYPLHYFTRLGAELKQHYAKMLAAAPRAPQANRRGASPEQPANAKQSFAAEPVGEPRFFLDHGAIHDRLTGRHVHGNTDVEYGVAEASIKMLNELAAAAATHPDARDASLAFDVLRDCNVRRQSEWCSNGVMPDLSYRSNELAGEVGEACNIVKKIERERLGWPGSRATIHDLGKELGDVVISIDLLASAAGINLAEYVTRSFNDKSAQMGHATFLPTIDRAMGAKDGKS